MTKQEMADQLRARKDEIAELEALIANYGHSNRAQSLLKGAQIMAFRAGVAACFEWFDQKAIALKEKRDFAEQLKKQTRGEEVKNV